MSALTPRRWLCIIATPIAALVLAVRADPDEGPRRGRAVMPRSEPLVVPPAPLLGTFYPDQYLFYGGGPNARTGHYPLGMFGPNSLSLIGPLSNFRATAAPVVTYTRGYDGSVRPSLGTSFSYPNLPALSPVVYPTRANVYPPPPVILGSPRQQSAIHWIDQN